MSTHSSTAYAPDKDLLVPEDVIELLRCRWDGKASTVRELVDELGCTRTELIEWALALHLDNGLQPSDPGSMLTEDYTMRRDCLVCHERKDIGAFRPYGKGYKRICLACERASDAAAEAVPIPGPGTLPVLPVTLPVLPSPMLPLAPLQFPTPSPSQTADPAPLVHVFQPAAPPPPPFESSSPSSSPSFSVTLGMPPEAITKNDLPPVLFEMLRLLPLPHQSDPWHEDDRERWLATFGTVLRLVYPTAS